MLHNEERNTGKSKGLSRYQLCRKKPIMENHETVKRPAITVVSRLALFPFVSCGILPGFF